VSLPDDRLPAILFRLARGLYFHARGERMPDGVPNRARRHTEGGLKNIVAGFKGSAGMALGDVFECVYMSATEDPMTTLWLLRFYRRVVFTVETGLFVEEA
jgi:hypothetical protein